MSNSNKIVFNTGNGKQIFLKRVEQKRMFLDLSGGLENPLSVVFYEDFVQVGEYSVFFDTKEDEIYFLSDLYFMLEEVNEVDGKQRFSTHDRVVTQEQVLSHYAERVK